MSVRTSFLGMWLFGYIVLCFSFQQNARSQDTGAITGHILDGTTGNAIADAVVRLGNTPVKPVTDNSGAFRMEAIPLATYTVRVEADGYATFLMNEVMLVNGATTDLLIELVPGAPSETVEDTYQAPAFINDVVGIKNSISNRELQEMPRLSPEEVIKTRAGVVSFDGQPGLFVRGNKANTVDYYLDGYKLFGDVHHYIPRVALEQLSVSTGPLSAGYGDVLGGVVNISTKAHARRLFATLEGMSSESLDPYGYNTIAGAAGGPLVGGRINFFAAGEYRDQLDSSPSVLGQLQVDGDVLDNLRAFPMSFRAMNEAGETVMLPIPAGLADGAMLDVDDNSIPVVTNGHITFTDGHTIDVQGVDPADIVLTPLLSAEYLPADAFKVKPAAPDRRKESLSLLGNVSVDVLPNTRLSVGGLFNRRMQDARDAGQALRVLFAPEMMRRLERDDLQLHAALRQRFSATTLLHFQGAYSRTGQEIYDPRFGRTWDDLLSYGDIDDPVFEVLRAYKDLSFSEDIRSYDNGTPFDPTDDETFYVRVPMFTSTYSDGSGPSRFDEVVGSLVQIPGGRFNGFEQFQENRIRLSGYFTAGIGRHQLSLGGSYETRTQRYWQINAPQLARYFADGHPEQISEDSPDAGGYATYNTMPLYLLETAVGGYYGYDLRGQNEVDSENLEGFVSQDQDKPLADYNLAPYVQEQFGGFLSDKVRLGNLTLDAGLRFDYFDNNSLKLKDPLARRAVCRVQDLGNSFNNICGDGSVPESMEPDFAVFYSGPNITGFRDNEGNFYDAQGQPIEPGQVLLRGRLIQTSNVLTPEVVTTYEPELTILPRFSASFVLANDLTLFASYGAYARYPSKQAFATLADFESEGTLPGANLKAERLTRLEAGFHKQWNDELATTIVGFKTEGRDLLTITGFSRAYPISYDGVTNRDFSTTRGIELGTFLVQDQLEASANYTLSFATGSIGQSYRGTIVWVGGVPPVLNDTPLSFDQRHRLNVSLKLKTTEKQGPHVLGLYPFENVMGQVLIQMGSGFPYTAVQEPFSVASSRTSSPRGDINGFRMPASSRVDIQIGRQFYFARSNSIEVFLLVQNLFNQTNINNVWPYSGQVDADGYLTTSEGEMFIEESPPNTELLYDHRNRIPSWAGIPRLVRLGMRLAF